MKDSPSCTADELAKLLNGLTSRRVQQLAAEGVIVKRGRGRYDLFQSVTGYIRYLQERSLRSDASPIDYHVEKARLTKNQADLAEIEAAKARGEVADVDLVARAWANVCAEARIRFRNIPARVVSALVGETDERKVKAVLTAELDQVLEGMAEFDATVQVEEDPEPEDE